MVIQRVLDKEIKKKISEFYLNNQNVILNQKKIYTKNKNFIENFWNIILFE